MGGMLYRSVQWGASFRRFGAGLYKEYNDKKNHIFKNVFKKSF